MKIFELDQSLGKILSINNKVVKIQKPDGSTIDVPQDNININQQNPNQVNLNLNNDTTKIKPGMDVQTNQNSTISNNQNSTMPNISPQQRNMNKNGSSVSEDGKNKKNDEEDFSQDLITHKRNKDIGGDPTDDFIDDIIDKKWLGGMDSRLSRTSMKESTEFYNLLRNAGLK